MSDDADAQHHEAVQGKAHRTSLATRLAVTVLLVSIASIVVAVFVSVRSIGGTANELVERRITARSNALVDELESFFRSGAANVEVLSGAESTIDAIGEFASAYEELDAIDLATLDAERESLGLFYLDEFVPALADVRGSSVDPITVAPGSDSAAVYLQAVYIAENPLEPGERDLLTDPDDGSAWTEAHRTYHPAFRAQIDGYGFRDLFLVSAESQAIVYSTNKDITLGTNVVTGPHSGTSMAALARRVFAEAQPGDVLSADIATYVPNLDAPSGFLAAPVYEVTLWSVQRWCRSISTSSRRS